MKQVIENLYRDPFQQDDFIDHFNALDSTSVWTVTAAGVGASIALSATGESAAVFTTGAVSEQDAILHTNRTWDIVDAQPIVCEFRWKYTEAATDDANVLLGLHDAPAADELQDAGGGPPASYSGVNFHKVDGGTAWIVESSVAGTQSTNTVYKPDATWAPGGGGYQSFRIEIRPISSTEAQITYGFDPAGGTAFSPCKDATTRAIISHTMTYTSFAAADCAVMLKAGTAGTSEVGTLDYARVSQVLT